MVPNILVIKEALQGREQQALSCMAVCKSSLRMRIQPGNLVYSESKIVERDRASQPGHVLQYLPCGWPYGFHQTRTLRS